MNQETVSPTIELPNVMHSVKKDLVTNLEMPLVMSNVTIVSSLITLPLLKVVKRNYLTTKEKVTVKLTVHHAQITEMSVTITETNVTYVMSDSKMKEKVVLLITEKQHVMNFVLPEVVSHLEMVETINVTDVLTLINLMLITIVLKSNLGMSQHVTKIVPIINVSMTEPSLQVKNVTDVSRLTT